jgi:Flp pilus assembly protein TadB
VEAPVTAKPGDEMAAAAAGRGRLRASHADREHVLDVLKAAFVQGRLSKDELDMRVGETFASRTYAELAALTADLPTGLIGAQPPRKPAGEQALHPMNKAVNLCACAALAIFVLGAALFSGNFGLFVMVVVAIFGIAFVVGGRMARSSYKKRSSPQRGDT